MIGSGKSARPGADDEHPLATAGGRRIERPASLPRKVAEEPLDRMDRHGAVEIGAIADGFTRVITDPSVDCSEGIVRNQLAPGLFVPARGSVRKPSLDVLPGRAASIAGRQQINVDGSVLPHRPGPGLPVHQVRQRRDVLRRSGHAITWLAAVLAGSHFPRIGFDSDFGAFMRTPRADARRVPGSVIPFLANKRECPAQKVSTGASPKLLNTSGSGDRGNANAMSAPSGPFAVIETV